MSGAAIEQVLGGIVVKLVAVSSDTVGIVRPDGRRAFVTSLLLDGFQFNSVHCDRVGAEVRESLPGR